MRPLLGLGLFAVLLSGCLVEEPDAGPSDAAGADDPAAGAAMPADVVFEGSLVGVGYQQFGPPVDPLPACALDDRQCARHTVTVPEGDWVVTFTLVGADGLVTGNLGAAGAAGSFTTDYDLFVAGVGESTNAAGAADVVEAELAPGDYVAEVLAWNDVDGGYRLTVSFAAA